MKNLILVIVIALFVSADLPQPVTIKIGEKVTSAGTSEVIVQLANVRPPSSVSSHQLIYITVDANNSGTIQFAVGESIAASHNAWPAGSKIPVTIRNGYENLRYKASASNQSFVVTQ